MKKNNPIEIIDQIVTDAAKKGVCHLYTEDESLDGRAMSIKGKRVINFGSCSYLGLEMDERLKKGTIESANRYGTQFSSSRAFLSSSQYTEVEEYFSEIFSAPIVIAPSTTLAHISGIPVLINDKDAIIMDHQIHASVQTAVQLTRPRGVHVEMIRHNRLDILVERIKKLRQKHIKVWYMIDGVYSMYGDFPPLKELVDLLDEYEQLHLYVDDAHGMSWTGKNGSGYALSQVSLHPKMVIATSLAKGFGVGGGILIFPNTELKRKVRTCGQTLIFSGPIQPPMLGAIAASAKIHLSDEISDLQTDLGMRIEYTNHKLKEHKLPIVAINNSPIFFVGAGLPRVAQNMVKRLMNEGYYSNIAAFPAVPVKCSGLRFTNTVHQTFDDIENMVKAMAYHLPKALEEEGRTPEDIYKAFKIAYSTEENAGYGTPTPSKRLRMQHEISIQAIDQKEWDQLLGASGSFNWKGLKFMEETFKDNPEPENNWEFSYYIIRDRKNNPVLATFFTTALSKDDIFSPAAVSTQIEEERQKNPYYLTSKVLMMGSLLTEGNHLYLDRKHKNSWEAMLLLMEHIWKEQERNEAAMINLRDFEADDSDMEDFLMEQGFIKVNLPDNHIIEEVNWNNIEEFLYGLNKKSRHHVRREILDYEHYYDVKIIENASSEEINHWYRLYNNVKNKSLELNTFDLPKKLFERMCKNPDWDIISLYLKPEYDERTEKLSVAVGFCYKNGTNYCPIVLGLDYNYLHSHKVYRQLLYQAIMRARALNSRQVYIGFGASLEKRRVGAKAVPKVAYVQVKDNYNMEVIGMMNAAEV